MSRSYRVAGSQSRLRELDRTLEGSELLQALVVLERRNRVGDDPRTRLQVRDSVLEDERPDRDARIERAAGQGVADRTGVGAAPMSLELRDDLHRPNLRRAR